MVGAGAARATHTLLMMVSEIRSNSLCYSDADIPTSRRVEAVGGIRGRMLASRIRPSENKRHLYSKGQGSTWLATWGTVGVARDL